MESTHFLWLDKLVSVKITWKFLAVFFGKFRQSSFVFYWPEINFYTKLISVPGENRLGSLITAVVSR